jgi:hypothetical protein
MVAPLLQPRGQLNRHPASTQFRTRPVAQSLDRRTGARGQALPSSGIGISATSSAVPATAGTPIQDGAPQRRGPCPRHLGFARVVNAVLRGLDEGGASVPAHWTVRGAALRSRSREGHDGGHEGWVIRPARRNVRYAADQGEPAP